MKEVKINISFFHGVRLFDLDYSGLFQYQGIYYLNYKLKYSFVDLYNQYAFFWSDSFYMPFHDWLCDLALSRLKDLNYQYKYNYTSQLSLPDIEFLDRYIEIETGLKGSYAGIKKRLYRNPHFVYIVVPNSRVKKRYIKNLHFLGRVLTLKEFYDFTEL